MVWDRRALWWSLSSISSRGGAAGVLRDRYVVNSGQVPRPGPRTGSVCHLHPYSAGTAALIATDLANYLAGHEIARPGRAPGLSHWYLPLPLVRRCRAQPALTRDCRWPPVPRCLGCWCCSGGVPGGRLWRVPGSTWPASHSLVCRALRLPAPCACSRSAGTSLLPPNSFTALGKSCRWVSAKNSIWHFQCCVSSPPPTAPRRSCTISPWNTAGSVTMPGRNGSFVTWPPAIRLS